MSVDLHIHTTASDGVNSPEEVVGRAKALGLKAIGITDHDTLEGVEPAFAAGRLHKIDVLPGVELGAERQGEEIHILGYLIKLHHREFLDKLAFFRETRIKRMEEMVKRIGKLGFLVTMERVREIAGSGSVGRPHLAAALVEAGVVENTTEAFEKYVGNGCPAYIPRYKLDPVEAVHLIRAAGGVPVLAHPGLNNTARLLEELIEVGLAGLEVCHPVHTREQVSYYFRLAGEYGLIATGGSDFHGPGHKAGCLLGAETVPYSVVEELKKAAER